MSGLIPAAIKKLEGEVDDWKRRHAAAVADLETQRSMLRKELKVTRRLEQNCAHYEVQLQFLEHRIGFARWNELVAEYEQLLGKAIAQEAGER
jgi:hypothetical protein